MRKIPLVTIVKLAALASGIAMSGAVGCATPYQSAGFRGGFSETQLAPNIFRISFRGNGYTSQDRAYDFTMLRAAELALANGYPYFSITQQDEKQEESSYRTPTTTYVSGTATSYGNTAYGSATATTFGGQTVRIRRPRTFLMIVCQKEKPEPSAAVFDAVFLRNSIRNKYGIDNDETLDSRVANPSPLAQSQGNAASSQDNLGSCQGNSDCSQGFTCVKGYDKPLGWCVKQ